MNNTMLWLMDNINVIIYNALSKVTLQEKICILLFFNFNHLYLLLKSVASVNQKYKHVVTLNCIQVLCYLQFVKIIIVFTH